MTSYTLSPVWGAGAQLFDNSGNVLTGGKIETYEAGTTTPAATYTDPIGNFFNSNPIIADASGRLANEIWLPVNGSYKFVLKDSNNVLIATYDNIPSIPQPLIVNDASSISYEQGYTVTAGAFTVGATYLITSVGSTNFVAIGAAANVTGILFTATGVGSGNGTAEYSRTVQAKLQERVSVKDFGAVGDGVADDTVAIQNAVASAKALYFPQGNYLISGTIGNGDVTNTAWEGDGFRLSIITCIGLNGGNAFVRPPCIFTGMEVTTRNYTSPYTGIGVQLGQQGSFIGQFFWSNIRVSYFSIGIDCYNFSLTSFTDLFVWYCGTGVRCIPTDSVPNDDGYFTTWLWNNVSLTDCYSYAFNCQPALGGRLLQWNNVSIERSASSSTAEAMAVIFDTTVVGKNVYFEGAVIPCINNRFSSISIENGWFSGTTGLLIGTPSSVAYGSYILKQCRFTDVSDRSIVVSGTSPPFNSSNIIFESCSQDFASLPVITGTCQRTYINSGGFAFNVQYPYGQTGLVKIGTQGPTTLDQINCYTKTVSTTVGANSSVAITPEIYIFGVWNYGDSTTNTAGTVAHASITNSYQPDLSLTVTPATTGSPNYFNVIAHNFSSSAITLTNAQISIIFYKHTGEAV